ncbi:MAG TPA: PAS domain S-box protein [Planctomycetaceae bacterium]|nr:PAS domain S-box protein [Planctomycetaceae bacterium]
MSSGGNNKTNLLALREAEGHFAHLVAGVQDYAIFLLTPEGLVKTWNAGAERIKGYAANEIIGKHFSQFYPPEAIASAWPDKELEIAKREGRFEDEGWRLRKDGTRFWTNVVITPIYAADRTLNGFLKITRDLTERRAAEESLRLSEQRFRLLVEGVKDYAIFMLDPDGRVMSWNTGAERIKGYKPAEIVGQHFSVFYPSEDVQSGKPARELEVAREQGSVEDEGWRVKKDRSLFWANVVITAIYDKDRRLVGYAKVTRDMTEKRKAAALEAADRQKNEFLAMLAHELRNPLAPIRNGLQLLRLPDIDPDTVQQTTEMMERQVVHLVRLVDDLLDVSRVIMGKMTFKREPVEITAVVSRAVEESQSTIDSHGHELMLSLPARPIIVDADIHRLAQVITNLLENAAKYTETPSQIWLSVDRHDDEAVIRVRDEGIGISPEMLPDVFNLFVQADNSLGRPKGGLGIGLNVVKRIVEMHDGTVTVSSPGLGQGSEFTVRLPVSKNIAPQGATKPSSHDVHCHTTKRKILVVDDNVDAAVTITALLKAWGHEVQTAYNGPSALETVGRFRPDIILLDIGLPGMSGYDVAKNVRAEPSAKGIIIAALTGYGQDADRQRSWEAGFDYHLTKPPDPTLLESLLASPRSRGQQGLPPVENN